MALLGRPVKGKVMNCAKCSQKLKWWQIVSPACCQSCGMFLDISRPKLSKRDFLFIAVVISFNVFWAAAKTVFPYLNSFIAYLFGFLVVALAATKILDVNLFESPRLEVKVISQAQYQRSYVSPKSIVIAVVVVAAVLSAIYFLMQVGLYYSPVGVRS